MQNTTNIPYLDCKIWATLKADTPFSEIFPHRYVPIRSLFPIIPKEEGNPPCYVVDGEALTEADAHKLARLLRQLDPSTEGYSDEFVFQYIREGLPLRTTWFSGRGTSDPKMLAMLADYSDETEDEVWDDEPEDTAWDEW